MRKTGRGHDARGGAGERCEDTPHGCEIEELFHVLGKTYVLDILHIVTQEGAGPQRFVELQSRLDMSPNTLSDRLKDLVKAGLLSRTSYNEIPPRVDYEATPKALDLQPVFESLAAWAARHTLRPEARAAEVPVAVAP
ncbi:MAG TPA: helix-turn-helix domain-containing protein [Thermoplasmata archaeon]